MMIETSSYNDMVIGTLVTDIRAFKNRFFVKMLFLLTKMLPNVVILTKNRFLNARMSVTSVPMIISL